MNADGSNEARLTASVAPDRSPSWSPDGTQIAFVTYPDGSSESNSEIHVMNADGTGQTRLTTNMVSDGQPTWSPDGSRIVCRVGYGAPPGAWHLTATGPGGSSQATA